MAVKRSTEIRRIIREQRDDMKARGLRIISFMNGGQTIEGMRANERLFDLKLQLEAALKAEKVPEASYVTTFCNFAHRMRDGRPIGHECGVIPPAALVAESDGDFRLACELIQAGKTHTRFGERCLPPSRGVKA